MQENLFEKLLNKQFPVKNSIRLLFFNGDLQPGLHDNFKDLGILVKDLKNSSHQGVAIELLKETKLPYPIELLFISSSNGVMVTTYPRITIIAKENSSATLFEHYIGNDDSTYTTNNVTEIMLEKNASVHHYKLQAESKKAFHTSSLTVNQKESSQLTSYFISTGSLQSRQEIHATLNELNTQCQFKGLYAAKESQQMETHILIDHLSPQGESDTHYRGILSDGSHGIFNGKVIVHPNAQKTKARQTNKNLLLSENAKADTRPEFEIYADDVACSHGATVGRLDEASLFYLRSRGIHEKNAKQILTRAFALEVLQGLPHQEINTILLKNIQREVI